MTLDCKLQCNADDCRKYIEENIKNFKNLAENEYKFKVKEKSGENKCFDAILKLETEDDGVKLSMSFTAESQTEDDCFIRFFNSFINGMKAKLLPVQIKEESCTRKKEEKAEERAACGRTVSAVKTDALAVVALLMAFLGGIVGLILGIIGREYYAHKDETAQRNLCDIAILIFFVWVVIFVLIIIFAF